MTRGCFAERAAARIEGYLVPFAKIKPFVKPGTAIAALAAQAR